MRSTATRQQWVVRVALAMAGILTVAIATPSPPAHAAGTVTEVVVDQAGYSAGAFKLAHVVATGVLPDNTFQVLSGSTVVASGSMPDRGSTWGSRVYDIDFSTLTQAGTYTLRSNGVSSYSFTVSQNMWDGYKDEMMAFYRLQRSGESSADAYPSGYSTVAPSAKALHGAGHLDDAASEDGSAHYDLTGGWYDAGDYGKYAGNQWVGGEIALAYVRHATAPTLQFDNDDNGVPDLVDEARFGSEYLIKWANAFAGALYDVPHTGGWQHPDAITDGISGTADDRRIRNLGVGGSAKAAGALAATARAIQAALSGSHIAADKVADFTAFAAACQTAAVTFYNYAAAHPDGPVGSYATVGGLPNSMLWAEVELYLLTGNTAYQTSATGRITPLTFADLRSTSYWDLRPLSLAEFYPAADTTTQTHIKDLLRQQAEYAMSLADDTPYGVLDTFSNFGVNEPHAAYLADLVRYYELFGDQPALREVLRGTNWIFGDNPWNISWVSGIGTDYVDFIHTRLDEQAYDHTNTGIVLPGAMVSGPNIRDPQDVNSAKPWYQDRPLWSDDVQQWRYNEPSISIEAGLMYTVMAMSDINDAPSGGGTAPLVLPITSPRTGDLVTGDVTVLAQPPSQMSAVSVGSTPMTAGNGVWSGTVNVDASAPYTNLQLQVRGTQQSNGHYTYSGAGVTVAPPLPDPGHPLLYDDFGNGGTWGSQNLGWVNWFNQSGGTGTYTQTTVDGRTVGRFAQTPSSSSSWAKFEPWHDYGNFAGYRYLVLTMKNPGYPDAQYKISLNDGTTTCSLTGGQFRSVGTAWADQKLDMDVCPQIDRGRAHLELWLRQASGAYGELLIDQISTTDDPSGTAPTLTAGSVSPTTGTSIQTFTYSVTYTDADNQAPQALQVVVDGVIHAMTAVDSSDTTYSDGKTYQYATTLPKGIHSYYFRTTDSTSAALSTATVAAPTVP
ncbi:glycoside hydrolase family 9 protein [Kribbella sp. NPDC000426]|uniref:glycoside hydrolase family 9 protein n=1 Tax=Kribbella sp. NPDC000426 TaxID=3154255 RepID=UPI00332C2027